MFTGANSPPGTGESPCVVDKMAPAYSGPLLPVFGFLAGAYTRSLSAQLQPCLTHKITQHTRKTP